MLTFLLGLILAIPVSIIANVFTPRVQRTLERRSRSQALRRSKKTKEEYYEIKNYVQNIDQFVVQSFITISRIMISGIASLLLIGVVLLWHY
jgi:H+/gluconate symporter-like permease